MKDYFKNCKTLDDAKNLFKILCFSLHPDTSAGDTQQEFIKMFKQFKQFTPTAQHTRKGDENFNADEFYNIVKRFEDLKNVLISFVGSFIWLEDEENFAGSTKEQKEDIKKIILEGYNLPRFAFKRKKWYYSPEGYKQKFASNKTFEQIKITWGTKTYKPNDKEQEKERKAQPQLNFA